MWPHTSAPPSHGPRSQFAHTAVAPVLGEVVKALRAGLISKEKDVFAAEIAAVRCATARVSRQQQQHFPAYIHVTDADNYPRRRAHS
jgi:hypothetical protein